MSPEMQTAARVTIPAFFARTLRPSSNKEIEAMNTRVANPLRHGRPSRSVPLVLCVFGALTGAANAQPATGEMLARSTPGATSDAPDPRVADEALRDRVARALHAQPYLEDRHINVSVHGGAVEISGFVYSVEELLEALRTARAGAGGAPLVDRLSIMIEPRR
jgi:hypothetical protein